MSFPVFHVTFGFLKSDGYFRHSAAIYGYASDSEDQTTAGTTIVQAPKTRDHGEPMASVRTTVDAWVTHTLVGAPVGAAPPDPSVATNPRRPCPANSTIDFFVPTGAKIAWSVA